MDYTRENSRELNELGLEFLAIVEQTEKGIEVYDRTQRQVEIVNEVVERMQPGVENLARYLLNRNSIQFRPGQRFGLDINLFNESQLGLGDLVNEGNITTIKKFGKYDSSIAWVSTYVLYTAKQGMQYLASTNNPKGYKWRRQRKEEEFPVSLNFDNLSNPDNFESGFSNGKLVSEFLSYRGNQCEIIDLAESVDIMKKYLGKLNPRTERIIRGYFGIGVKEHTLKEIGSELGISRERVRQIKAKGLKKMREILNSKNLIDLFD